MKKGATTTATAIPTGTKGLPHTKQALDAVYNARELTEQRQRDGEAEMDIYQLDYILHEPEESQGWMYLAEAPALQGCMAWGDTPEETLKSLLAVAQTIIELRKESGEPLPTEMAPLRSSKGSLTVTA